MKARKLCRRHEFCMSDDANWKVCDLINNTQDEIEAFKMHFCHGSTLKIQTRKNKEVWVKWFLHFTWVFYCKYSALKPYFSSLHIGLNLLKMKFHCKKCWKFQKSLSKWIISHVHNALMQKKVFSELFSSKGFMKLTIVYSVCKVICVGAGDNC